MKKAELDRIADDLQAETKKREGDLCRAFEVVATRRLVRQILAARNVYPDDVPPILAEFIDAVERSK